MNVMMRWTIAMIMLIALTLMAVITAAVKPDTQEMESLVKVCNYIIHLDYWM